MGPLRRQRRKNHRMRCARPFGWRRRPRHGCAILCARAACQNAFGEALRRCETRRRALHAEFFLREGERAPQLCSGTAPGVLSALRQIVLLARARVRLYESAKENALPLAPETARRFAAECRAEESAAARLLALSMK